MPAGTEVVPGVGHTVAFDSPADGCGVVWEVRIGASTAGTNGTGTTFGR